ncbi:hypothetical protein MesoLjLc_50630 [Mesorhizobium sp. L-8-10]|uniref:hypothetical protein n=1 Tax=Mesorhizobium sp. L-8-10 TaxID=2744523 RepID=UPI001925B11D|nr:hypothetical protein [Mesorhizobium sp. L-8-10]BCH33133.1 hypothetical protein MesoLjLc_50630 [Mesorhizobium sp. L-8-10]
MAKFKKISADEARSLRKDHVRDTGRGSAVAKAFKAPPSWDGERRSARFIMTSQSVDRYGDIVVTSGLDTTEFERNPVGLLFHNSRTWPVAKWDNLEKILKGRPPRLEGDFVMLPPGGPVKEIDECAWMIENGGIRANSIGFIPDWDEIEMILDDEGQWTYGLKFNKSELIECSVCAVPANADALARSADGDMRLAKELLEDILDNWAKTPEGLLIPMDEYRAKHLDLGVNRSTFIVDKSLAPAAPKFVPVAEMTLKAATNAEAEKFVGAKVTPNPDHPENKDWPFDVLAKATGEIIASWIVADGEFKGVHALAVEFLTDEWQGMFRGIKAERFLLTTKAEDEDEPDDESGEESADSEGMDDPEDEGKTAAPASEKRAEAEKTVSAGSITVEVNTKGIDEAKEKVSALDALIDTVSTKLAKLFGRKSIEQELPVPPTPPSADVIAAAKSKAESTRQRLIEKGLIKA